MPHTNYKQIDKKYYQVHYWLRKNYGQAICCENKDCEKKVTIYQWAKLKDKDYDFKRENFKQLCRGCHTKYDFTDETIKKLIRTHIGIKFDDKRRKNISNSLKGRKVTELQGSICGILRSKPVDKIKDRKVIATYKSMIDADRSMGFKAGCVSGAIKRNIKLGGYEWRLSKTTSPIY